MQAAFDDSPRGSLLPTANEPLLPKGGLLALAVTPPLIALLLDPDPQDLASTARESARSVATIWLFSMCNGSATHFAINACDRRALHAGVSVRARASLVIALVLVVAAAVTFGLSPLWRALDPRLTADLRVLFVRTALLAGLYVAISLVVQRFRVMANAARLASIQSRHREALAKLEALQTRTNPHFLFNSLDAVLELLAKSPADAEATLERLTALYRYALTAAETPLAKATDELEMARGYLAVAKARFGSRLSIEWNVDDAVARSTLPSMSLQPIVENAITHGVAQRSGITVVRVDAALNGDSLAVCVSNDLPASAGVRRGSGTSMRDLRERVRLLYGEGASLDHGRDEQGRFRTVLQVPQRASEGRGDARADR
ncbi:MAG: histidine kinase [Myxococcales bacterium]|nr:histidine kinase [Myxococcales bacterium]